jgi:hypothetical protein
LEKMNSNLQLVKRTLRNPHGEWVPELNGYLKSRYRAFERARRRRC